MDHGGTAEPTSGEGTEGSWERALSALRRLAHPEITITDPPENGVVDWDVAVPMRDGVSLRVNVFRPEGRGRHPVLLSAHPYGKDNIPLHHRTRHGYRAPAQYHLMRSAPLTHSAWTSWEAPDPAYWVEKGYVVVNADLRGWGTSEGDPTVFSAQEGLDVHDLVEWAAVQDWSTGRVGLSGVSYLAIAQWRAAATRPPHLAAICPWEGFTDLYRDFARPGGILETGFLTVWSTLIKRSSGGRVDLRSQVRDRPLFEKWYQACDPDLEAIEVPALVCGSFSDHNLHSGGSFEGFRRLGSSQKWLYTHRGPKWATFYSVEGLRAQEQFFDHFLKGEDTGITEQPPVRLEIREDRTTVAEVRHVASWPPDVRWQTLHCRQDSRRQSGTLVTETDAPAEIEQVDFAGPRGRATFTHRFEADTAVVGPMLLRLTLSVRGAADVPLFAGVRKFRDGKEVTFEGSYGFQGDLVTHGMLMASHRDLDPDRSGPHRPFHPSTRRRLLEDDRKVELRIGLLPSATLFRAGEELRLDLQGHWFHHRDPVHGQFPVGYQARAEGTVTLHLGAGDGCELTVPVLAADQPSAESRSDGVGR